VPLATLGKLPASVTLAVPLTHFFMETSESLPDKPTPVPVYPNLVTALTPVGETPLEITRIIQILYQDVEIQINRADLKAQIALSTSAIIGALVVNLGIGLRSREFGLWSGLEWAVAVVYGLFLLSASGTVLHALLAAYPRAVGKRNMKADMPGLYFSGHLVRLQSADFAERFMNQTNREVLERILVQIHSKSRVLEAKLGHIRRALRLLGMALLLWAISRILLLAVYGRLPGAD
jgi:hypothetical protein